MWTTQKHVPCWDLPAGLAGAKLGIKTPLPIHERVWQHNNNTVGCVCLSVTRFDPFLAVMLISIFTPLLLCFILVASFLLPLPTPLIDHPCNKNGEAQRKKDLYEGQCCDMYRFLNIALIKWSSGSVLRNHCLYQYLKWSRECHFSSLSDSILESQSAYNFSLRSLYLYLTKVYLIQLLYIISRKAGLTLVTRPSILFLVPDQKEIWRIWLHMYKRLKAVQETSCFIDKSKDSIASL